MSALNFAWWGFPHPQIYFNESVLLSVNDTTPLLIVPIGVPVAVLPEYTLPLLVPPKAAPKVVAPVVEPVPVTVTALLPESV